MRDYYSKFESHQYYHIYNRANGCENIFREPRNYSFFLNKWQDYLGDILDVWAYCLLPNHFHFLIKVRGEEILTKFQKLDKSDSEIVSNQFRSLFISYTKSFNKVYNRHGSLFQKPFKHVLINSDTYLFTLIHYIHHNPIHHGFTKDFADWKYSSYSAITGKSKTNVKKTEVLDLFGSRKQFIASHDQMKNYKQINHLIIE